MQAEQRRARHTGLAITLIFIIWSYFAGDIRIAIPAGITFMLALAVPNCFALLAPWWFRLAELMGALTSRIILAVLFFALLTPIALMRRLMGADPLSLGLWKADDGSAFIHRSQKFEPRHLEKPF